MIKVIRIAGESFDLESKQEMPKALILSNGKREYSIYVDDETAKAVVELMMESPPARVAPKNGGSSSTNSPRTAEHIKVEVKLADAEVVPAPQMATIGDAPEPEVADNGEMDPGEEYDDPTTGAESV